MLTSSSPAKVISSLNHEPIKKRGITLHFGDQVQLKSGSITMMVTRLRAGLVSCSWMDSYNNVMGGTFPAEALKKVKFSV